MSDTILQSNDVMDSRRGDIVVGVDGSDESFAALRWALGEASLTGQQVNAVYAWTHPEACIMYLYTNLRHTLLIHILILYCSNIPYSIYSISY